MAKVGIFGGTFNPIHKGHMHLADAAFRGLELDKLIFVPSNIPPHKPADELCPDADRLEMCRLAIDGICGYELSDFEISREGKSYSYYTVKYFTSKYPDDKFFLIVGSDMLLTFDKWYRFDDIFSMLSLAVVSREKDDTDKLREKADELSTYGKIYIINADAMPLSSTEIRAKIKNNQNYSCYLPEKVVQYIRSNNLYSR